MRQLCPRRIHRSLSHHHHEFRAMSRSLWSFASWLLPLVVVFIAIPPLLATLGPARFGVTMIVLLTPNLAVLLDWGLTASGVRRVAVLSAAGPIPAFSEPGLLALAF